MKPLLTNRLVLTPLTEEAAPLVLAFYQSNINTFEPWEPTRADQFYTLAYQKASLSVEQQQIAKGKLLRYWVFLKDDPDQIIGSICFQNILMGPFRSCSIGYKLSLDYQQQGYAYEAVSATLDYLFDILRFHRIEAYVLTYNMPSIRLLQKLNFDYEGISYSYANINGKWQDHNRFSYINPKDR